jgi:uncharacterized protein (DUF983 family)
MKNDVDSKDIIPKYTNYYRCPECGEEWQDVWDCKCNDRCPNCNTEIEPYQSNDISVNEHKETS